MILQIKNIVVAGDFILSVEFNDGYHKMVNLKPYLGKGIFKQLQDPAYFLLVKNNGYFISWPNDQELSADTLYYC
jgi:hypothetical protein